MSVQRTTRAYPKIMNRWVADVLADDAAYSPASLAMFAVKQRVLRQEHANRFRIMAGRLVREIPAETEIKPHGIPVEAWWAETWKRVLYKKAPPAPQPPRYRFLIERAVDGEKHHANSLAWLITEADIREQGLDFPTLEAARSMARRGLARIRRKHITVKPDGKRGIQSDKRQFTVQYPTFDAAVWKSAVGIPGYYGLHVPEILGEPMEVPPDT